MHYGFASGSKLILLCVCVCVKFKLLRWLQGKKIHVKNTLHVTF